VRNGHARATRGHRDGRLLTLATFGPGDIFGELKTITTRLRTHSDIGGAETR
jgi:CRP-like cAMP-binding protein